MSHEVTLLLSAALLSGCYASHELPGTADGGGVTEADAAPDAGEIAPDNPAAFLAAFFAQACEDAVRCSTAGTHPTPLNRTVLGTCHSEGRRRYFAFGDRDLVIAGVNAGRLGFDRDAARRCLSAMDDLPCSGGAPPGYADCDRVFTGAVPDGSPCAMGLECELGSFCGGSECPARCMAGASAGLGEQCDRAHPCAYPSTCSGDGRCVPIEGARPLGASCFQSEDCAPGLRCFDLVCTHVPVAGERCGDGAMVCEDPSYCGPDGICHPRLAHGARCEPMTGFAYTCPLGDLCLGGRCVRAPRPGEPCMLAPFDACPSPGFFCDAAGGSSTGRCAPLRELGEPCESDGQCRGSGCVGGVCTASETGDACEDGAPDWCVTSCTDGTCAAPSSEGETCSHSARVPCADGLTCREMAERDWRCVPACD